MGRKNVSGLNNYVQKKHEETIDRIKSSCKAGFLVIFIYELQITDVRNDKYGTLAKNFYKDVDISYFPWYDIIKEYINMCAYHIINGEWILCQEVQ